MVVGLLRVELRIGDSQSLKEKRRALTSVKDRVRRAFNVSVSETDDQDVWQAAQLGIACVGTDRAGVSRVLSLVEDMLDRERAVELVRTELEML